MRKNKYKVKLNIGAKTIEIASAWPLADKRRNRYNPQRYSHFLRDDSVKADIKIAVEVAAKLPDKKGKELFTVYHFDGGAENWRWLKIKNGYIYKSPLKHKQQTAVVSRDFSRAKLYCLPWRKKFVWDYRDVIYDFLQILLINYLAFKKEGLILHAAAVKDTNSKAIICAGKSGSGKSTLARLWHFNTQAMVLNDDRVIVRKHGKRFIAYGSPWHGEFSDYLEAHPDKALLDKLFIIEHAKKNFTRKLDGLEAFKLLYPAIIPIFWDKQQINKVVTLCQELTSRLPCARLGFAKNKKVISFIRSAVDK